MSELTGCTLNNPIVGSINSCTGQVEWDNFNYTPHLWIGVVYVVVFSLTSIAHLYQGIRSKQWYLLCTAVLCGFGELLGWSARTWAHVGTIWIAGEGGFWHIPSNAFIMQIVLLILSPAFVAAAWYIILGRLLKILGPQYCRFNPLTYAIIFVTGDLASLIVQAVGGAHASAAVTLHDADVGANIMLGGIATQLVVMTLFVTLLSEFVWRYFTNRPVKPFRFKGTKPAVAIEAGTVPMDVERKANILIIAITISTFLIYIRSVYRIIELAGGWNAGVIDNESLFCGLDGLMVALALITLNIVHPLNYLPKHLTAPGSKEKSSTEELV